MRVIALLVIGSTGFLGGSSFCLPVKNASSSRGRRTRAASSPEPQQPAPEILQADVDNALTFSIAFWAELAQTAEESGRMRDALLLCPSIPEDAIETLANSYVKAAVDFEDILPDLKDVRVKVDTPEYGPLAGTKGIRMTRVGGSHSPGSAEEGGKAVEALKEWVNKLVAGAKVCPYTASAELSAVSLESKGVHPGGVTYPASLGTCSAAVIRDMWFATTEMLNASPEDIATVVMAAPHFASHKGSFRKWVAWTDLMASSLHIFAIDAFIKLIVFHPDYSRSEVEPVDAPAHCHLPPASWMPPMMRSFYASSMPPEGEEDSFPYEVSDFQRRSPCPAVNILRADVLEKAVVNNIVDLPGRPFTRVSSAKIYCTNTLNLSKIGKEELQSSVDELRGRYTPAVDPALSG